MASDVVWTSVGFGRYPVDRSNQTHASEVSDAWAGDAGNAGGSGGAGAGAAVVAVGTWGPGMLVLQELNLA
jgi:hypothetical protein